MTDGDGSTPAGDHVRLEALRARRAHPATVWFGPVYGVMERTEAGWLTSGLTEPTPQAARDGLGWWLRTLGPLVERERLDELVVAGRRFRVVRADRFYRYGPSGPEPPRPTDPDGVRGPFDRPPEIPLGPGETPGGAALFGERWEAVPQGPLVPPGVTRDARKALTTHPRVAMLAARFAVAEAEDGRWAARTEAVASPSAARGALAVYFTEIVPALLKPPEDDLAAYREAASRLRRERSYQVRVAGRRFRIIRVETAVRVGPDGPESPRPSDR